MWLNVSRAKCTQFKQRNDTLLQSFVALVSNMYSVHLSIRVMKSAHLTTTNNPISSQKW